MTSIGWRPDAVQLQGHWRLEAVSRLAAAVRRRPLSPENSEMATRPDPDGWPGRFAAFDFRFVQMAYVFSSLCGGREGWCGSPLVASHTSPGPDLGPRLCAALSSLSHRGVVVGRRWGPSSLRPRQLRGSGSQSGRWALSSLGPFVLAPSSASRLRRRLALASCPLGWLPWRGRGVRVSHRFLAWSRRSFRGFA